MTSPNGAKAAGVSASTASNFPLECEVVIAAPSSTAAQPPEDGDRGHKQQQAENQDAVENAERAGLKDRFSTIAGNAFEVDLGSGYDVVLLPNFLHHFNKQDCVRFLKKVHAALREGGRVAIAEFVPNPDRVSPPEVATFSFIMLANTPEGDAYTLPEFEEMLTSAGFHAVESHDLPPVATAVIAQK